MSSDVQCEAPVSEETRAAQHFLILAKRGKRRGASGGEVAAHKLAKAIAEHACRMDGRALRGAKHFMELASVRPCTASDLLNG